MEATIKYETCDDFYAPDAVVEPIASVARLEMSSGAPQTQQMSALPSCSVGNLKRNYSELITPNNDFYGMNAGGGGGGGGGGFQMQPTQCTNFFAQDQIAMATTVRAVPMKRFKRGESSVLFAPPFFELQQNYNAVTPGGTIMARCLSCQVILRGSKNVSSNFIKHMKRVHPDMHKAYENIKLLKFRGYPTADPKVMPTPGGGGKDVEQGYFDANAFLENIRVGDEEHNSEATDNSETPPNSNETNETVNNAVEAQQQPQFSGLRLVEGHKILEMERTRRGNSYELCNKTLDNLLNEKLKAFVSRSEYNETKRVVNQLTSQQGTSTTNDTSPASSEGSNRDDEPADGDDDSALKTRLNVLELECQRMRENMQTLQQGKRQLQRELETTDRLARRRKFIVRNLKLENNEKPHQAMARLLSERLSLSNIALQKVIILGQTNKAQNVQNTRQHLLVELQKADDAHIIFKNCAKLKGTGIYIEPELSKFTRKRKNKLLVLRKELLRRNAGLKVFVRSAQLLVCGKPFYWDDVEGLCAGDLNSMEVDEDLDAIEQLKALTSYDMKEFLNVLKNYDVK